MKSRYNTTMIITGLFLVAFASCKKEQPAVEYSPIFPISGEWHTHIYNEDGGRVENMSVLRTYNTSDNLTDAAWFRLITPSRPTILAKIKADVANKAFVAGDYQDTQADPAVNFSIIEGKVLLNASKQPSDVVADSIYVKYKTGAEGDIYTVKGHRRTAWPEDEY